MCVSKSTMTNQKGLALVAVLMLAAGLLYVDLERPETMQRWKRGVMEWFDAEAAARMNLEEALENPTVSAERDRPRSRM